MSSSSDPDVGTPSSTQPEAEPSLSGTSPDAEVSADSFSSLSLDDQIKIQDKAFPPSEQPNQLHNAESSTASRQATGGPPQRPSIPHAVNSAPPTSIQARPGGFGSGGGGPPSRTGAGAGGIGGGPMSAQERARQMAGTRLPPSLQAKLAANANRAASTQSPSMGNGGPGGGSGAAGSPSFLRSNQRIDATSFLSRPGGPAASGGGPSAFPPSSAPGMNGLAARRAGAFPGGQPPSLDRGFSSPAGPVSSGGPGGLGARRAKPGLKLSDMGGGPAASNGASAGGPAGANASSQANRSIGGTNRGAAPGRLSGAPKGGLMSSAFSEFSDVIDPSGRLNFAGKAVLHASGVEFGNGTSFQINMEDLELQDVLGKGNYGEVRKVKHTKTGVEMAMKEIRLELDASKLNAIIMELDILHRALSPDIVEFYGAFFVESCVFYCIEYMDAGSLENLYNGRSSVPEDVLARIVKHTVKGLAFLKDELQIMHRDVKPTNILVNRKGEVKLCDFGVSGQLEKSLAKTNIGCQSYMAPERIKGESLSMPSTYTVASDVWSLGLSIVETTVGVYPYPPETYSNVFAQLQAIVHGDAPQLPAESYSESARDFVAGCLEKVPERRFTYSQMLKHEWLIKDDERGADGVDMKGWVASALAKRKEIKEQQSKAPL
ncbi:unnamed protein product [Sympodiomycopsis kandeliae]